MQAGRLIYLIGASGAGKDSLINQARSALADRNVHIVRRIITRSAEASNEQAYGVSMAQFEAMADQGEFSMHWAANGLRYGIPSSIEHAMAQGQWILVNGSRAYLPWAFALYPDLLAVLVVVDTEVLRARLTARAREPLSDIETRLARNEQFGAMDVDGQGPRLHRVDNSATLEHAVTHLLAVIDQAQST